MMKFLIFVSSMLFSISVADPIGSGWQQTFAENWSGGVSFPNWMVDTGTSYPGGSAQWGTGEIESYDVSALSITDNTLSITPQLEADGTWTSGRLETKQDFTCAQGGKLWIEASIRLGNAPTSQMQGIWPAFWALGSSFRGNYQNWPMASEWDFLESINGLPTMYTTIHCGTAPGGPCNEDTGISSYTPFTKGVLHKVAFEVDRSTTSQSATRSATTRGGMGGGTTGGTNGTTVTTGTWQDETLNWYLDGNLVFSVKGSTVNDQQAWTQLAAAPHFLLLNVAVGGSFPNGVAGGTTPTSATIGGSTVAMEVESVNVWNSAT